MNSKKRKPKGYWKDKENCLKEARVHEYKVDFQKKAGGAHASCVKNGWIKEACAHMKKKVKIHEQIIIKFLPHRYKLFSGNDWAREVMMLKKLFTERGEDFWKALERPEFTINSMAFFQTASGKEYIRDSIVKEERHKRLLKSIPATKEEKEIERIEPEQYETSTRPRTVLQFLNKYGSKEKNPQDRRGKEG
jgi:hypothetical protein